MKREGLRNILGRSLSLEELLFLHLKNAPSLSELSKVYEVDGKDRRRARKRALIVAALDAIVAYHYPEEEVDSIEVEANPDTPTSQFFAAWRELRHDFGRLDRGVEPDALLVKAAREALPDEFSKKPALYKRRLLIYWLVAAELWSKKDSLNYPSRRSVYEEAHKCSGISVSSLATELSNIKKKGQGFSQEEQTLFDQTIDFVRKSVHDPEESAFMIFLPAVKALSLDADRHG
jgi:hypothetical protein